MEEYSGEIDNQDTIEGADNDSNVVFGEYSDAVNLHSHSLAFEKSFQLRVLVVVHCSSMTPPSLKHHQP